MAHGALSGNHYRPHLVVGDPSQREAIREGNHIIEEYLGVTFHKGPDDFSPGAELTVVLKLLFYPHVAYDALVPGATFTIREGPRIVGYGRVVRWLDQRP